MYICSLCEVELEQIPLDAIRIGNVYRFTDGSFHFLRKKIERAAIPKHVGGHSPDEALMEKDA